MSNVVVCDALSFGVWNGFVIVVTLGISSDDVPGMYKTRNVAQYTEEDVDERVAGADAGFDPYCDRRKQDGDEAQEEVATRHGEGDVSVVKG
jgi:hypothetical protein